MTFDYDASLQSQILQQTKTLLSEIATPPRRGRPGRPKKSLNTLDFVDSGKENEQLQPVPKRQSSRIAKLREKEDEERRLAESNRLQRLKEEHGRREKRRLEREERKKKIEEKQQRYQLKSITGAPTEVCILFVIIYIFIPYILVSYQGYHVYIFTDNLFSISFDYFLSMICLHLFLSFSEFISIIVSIIIMTFFYSFNCYHID